MDGSDIHLRYRDIISAEHFAHMINIRTTAGKTLATRQSFKAFTEPLKKDPRFFVCGRGAIINMENAADFQAAAFCMTDGSRVYVSQELLKAARQALWNFCCKGACGLKDVLRPVLELTVVFPGLLLAYFPVGSYLKLPPAKLAAGRCRCCSGFALAAGCFAIILAFQRRSPCCLLRLQQIFLYRRTLRISLWKSGTIALAVCAVFACLNSLSRAVGTAIVIRMQLPPDKPWFCFGACIFYNAVCWLITAAAYYPATHAVRAMVEDDNFAQTWYVFSGTAAGVHPAEALFINPALPDNAPDRAGLAGLHRYEHRAFCF